jgi:hypothetical protein
MKYSIRILALGACALAFEAHADARADLLAAYEKAMAETSYRVVTTSQLKGKPVQTTIDVQLPASFHMKNPDVEMIVLPGATWMNQGGQWMKMPMDMSAMVKGMTLQAMKDGADLIKDVRATGTETIDGCESTTYAYRTEGKIMGVDANADVEVSICETTGLPVRAVSSDGKTRTEIAYDYETKVEIRPPQ